MHRQTSSAIADVWLLVPLSGFPCHWVRESGVIKPHMVHICLTEQESTEARIDAV